MMRDSLKPEENGTRGGIVAGLPRRRFIESSVSSETLSQMRFVSFKTNRLRSIASLLKWYELLFDFFFNIVVDIILGRDNLKRRAVRLRRAFEHKGGSFVKLGLHLSMRLDFVPWE